MSSPKKRPHSPSSPQLTNTKTNDNDSSASSSSSPRSRNSSFSSTSSDSSTSSTMSLTTANFIISNWYSTSLKADTWPSETEGPPPTLQMLNASNDEVDAAWTPAARGCIVKHAEGKGKGLFATRVIKRRAVITVYIGETLTELEYQLRHNISNFDVDSLEGRHRDFINERNIRLTEVNNGCCEGEGGGGVVKLKNNGEYVFDLMAVDEVTQEAMDAVYEHEHEHDDENEENYEKKRIWKKHDDEHVRIIDGEDPNLSSWARYINHAPHPTTNAAAKINSSAGLIWIEADRDIEIGEEILFDYADGYSWDGDGPV